MTDDIRPVPVRELLRNLTDSLDLYDLGSPEGWLDMMAEKVADEEFPALLHALMAEGQQAPIAVSDWYGADGEPLWEMGNGHHRLTAAILLGWDEVMVVFTYQLKHKASGWGEESDSLDDWIHLASREGARELAEMVMA